MNKILIVFFIIGLMFATIACSSGDKSNVNSADNSNANPVQANDNAAAPASNNNNAANTGNVKSISDVKRVELLGKTVTVQGIVVNNLKIGRLSGYRLKDASDSIPISSVNLATINTTVTVTGVLSNSSYFGYYILVNE